MHFIRFTNQWKGEHLEEGKKLLKSAQSHEAQSLFEITPQSTPEDKKITGPTLIETKMSGDIHLSCLPQ